jgi:hypothetical protein
MKLKKCCYFGFISRSAEVASVVGAVACGPHVLVDHQADAEVYVQALCEETCSKYDECEPDPVQFGECVVSECIENLSEDFNDPCFAEWDEFRRCQVERESCEEQFDVHIETRPGSVCHDVYVVYTTCRTEHPQPLDD